MNIYSILLLGVLGISFRSQGAGLSTPNAPYIATFQQSSKTLIYVAARHHNAIQYPDAMKDPVFETVQKVFSDNPPQAVIIEGVDPSYMSGIAKFAAKCAAANYNLPGQMCDEGSIATYNANQIGAALMTGEPAGPDVLSRFISQGYSAQDVLALYVMTDIPPLKNHETLTHQNFPAIAEGLLTDFHHVLGTTVPFTFDDFTAWYAGHMPVPLDYLDITTDETGPYNGSGATELQILSFVSSSLRNRNVVATIQKALSQYDRVLVVYGATHLVDEESSLEQLLGVPQISKPF